MKAVNLETKTTTKKSTTKGNYKIELAKVLPEFEEHKTAKSKFEKMAKDEGDYIKEIMLENKINEFSANGVKATISTTTRQDLDPVILLEILKENNVQGVIKTQEYVDSDALEAALYNEDIDPALLVKAQLTKTTVTLRTSKVKSAERI